MSNNLYTGDTLIAKANQIENGIQYLTKDKQYPILNLNQVAVNIINDQGNEAAYYHHEVNNYFIS